MMIRSLTKYYGDELVFADVSANIPKGARIGLVGANGIGKTTLLRVLAGRLDYAGEILCPKAYQIGLLEQGLDVENDRSCWGGTVHGYLQDAFAALLRQGERIKEYEQQMASPDVFENRQALEAVMNRYAQEQQAWEEAGGYDYQAQIKSAAIGLGFSEPDLQRRTVELSGGEKIRLRLARMLLEAPDLLLLDEPTNHLDMDAAIWLENFLQSYRHAFIVVSHDRYFLDRTVHHIWELEARRVHRYRGGYTEFLPQQEQRQQAQEGAEARRRQEIAKMEDYIRRYGEGNRASQAQSRMKKLARLQQEDPGNRPQRKDAMQFSLTVRRQPGKQIVSLKNVGKEYRRPVLSGITVDVRRNERIAIVGPNGAGKTTLLRILAGEIGCTGQVRWGSGIEIGYFSQNIQFEARSSVLEELYEEHPMDLGALRTVLARFLFTGEEVFKQTSMLSGGERNRLALAKLLLRRANVLLLDEPTNHLDIYARSSLEKALMDYGGTIIFVSHDRYFIRRLGTRIWHLDKGTLFDFAGNFQQFLDFQREQASKSQPVAPRQKASTRMKEKEKQPTGFNREELEAKIMELEERKELLEQEMSSEALYKDEKNSKRVVGQYRQVEAELDHCYRVWEDLVSE